MPKVIIRHNIGPISAAKSRLLLLGQCHCLHQSSAGPTTAAFFDCFNLPTFSRNLAQYRPYTKNITGPCVTFTTANHSGSEKTGVRHSIGPLLCRKQVLAARVGRQVHTGVIIPATARHWQPIFGKFVAMMGQCWAVYNFALGYVIFN